MLPGGDRQAEMIPTVFNRATGMDGQGIFSAHLLLRHGCATINPEPGDLYFSFFS
jgi:hypothetical protein